jgi:hypothetical protein
MAWVASDLGRAQDAGPDQLHSIKQLPQSGNFAMPKINQPFDADTTVEFIRGHVGLKGPTDDHGQGRKDHHADHH